jgi:polyisoprenoid-binding protein YceI
MIRRIAAILLALAMTAPGAALAASQNVADLPGGAYVLDRKHSSVIAKATHLGVSLYTVRFDVFDADFSYEPAHPEAARLRATIDAASMDVGADYGRRFADEFLDAGKFPKITFVSRQIGPGVGHSGTMTGELTLRGVTAPVTFDVTFNGVGKGLFGGTVSGFTAVATIKRSQFGSNFLQNVVGDEVRIEIEAEFDRK